MTEFKSISSISSFAVCMAGCCCCTKKSVMKCSMKLVDITELQDA